MLKVFLYPGGLSQSSRGEDFLKVTFVEGSALNLLCKSFEIAPFTLAQERTISCKKGFK